MSDTGTARSGTPGGLAAEWGRRASRRLLDGVPFLVFEVDTEGVLRDANREACELVGVVLSEVEGAPLVETPWLAGLPRSQEDVLSAVRFGPSGTQVRLDTRFRNGEGEAFPVEVTVVPMRDVGGQVDRLIVSASDISERKLSESLLQEGERRYRNLALDLERSLAEKEVLLREVHHRVKNNLQTIVSLLRLQRSITFDGAAAESLSESERRVHAIAQVHERLYRSRELAEVQAESYLRGLLESIGESIVHEGVRLELEAAGAVLDIDRMIPVGLVTNELVTNALKHAFADGRPGVVRVVLRRDGSLRVLSVSDDGVGSAADLDPDAMVGLGLRLVHLMARQLHGEVEIRDHRPRGVEVRLSFPAGA